MTGSSSDDPRPPHRPDAEPPAPQPGTGAEPPEAAMDAAAAAPDEPAGTAPGPDEPAGTDTAREEPEVRVADAVDRSTVRHAPRFGRFILAGVVLGAVVAGVLALLTPASQYSPSDLFWILFLALGLLLGIAAAGLAVALDRRSIARREERTAGRRTPPEA